MPPDNILTGAIFRQDLTDKQAQCGQRWIAPVPVMARLRLDDLGGGRPFKNRREHPTSSLGKLVAQCCHATTHLLLPFGSIHLG